MIVECGFLSNYKEAQKLVTEDYQKSVAEAVAEGNFVLYKSKMNSRRETDFF